MGGNKEMRPPPSQAAHFICFQGLLDITRGVVVRILLYSRNTRRLQLQHGPVWLGLAKTDGKKTVPVLKKT